MIESVALGVAIASFIIAVIGCVFAFIACYKIIGVEKSTHTVQMMPVEDSVKDPFSSGFNNFMDDTLSPKLEKDHKLYREQIKEEMPQFAPDEEDEKIISW
jgi:hypothetical protein